MTVHIPRVIRTYRTVRQIQVDGTVQARTQIVLDVPASEMTWQANCATIAVEALREGRSLVIDGDVDEVCRRLLGLDRVE